MKGPNDPSPMSRNPFRPEEYFTLDVQKGVLRGARDARMLALPEQLIKGLHLGLEEETGAASPIVLYSIGKWWGARYAARLAEDVKSFMSKELADLPLAVYVQVLKRSWGMFGWGRLELSFDMAQAGFVLATVDGAPYSTAVGKLDRPSDHLVAGVLAALLSNMAGRELACVEIACKSQGDESCKFVIGTAERLSPVNAWVKQRRTVAEICESLRASASQ